jgi:hypothetical protein
LKRYKMTSTWMYNPPILGSVNGLLGSINMGNAIGGTNWPGVAYDPELHTVFAQANDTNITATSLVAPPKGFSTTFAMSRDGGPRVPRSAWPRRLLRGRFTAAVAQIEAARANADNASGAVQAPTAARGGAVTPAARAVVPRWPQRWCGEQGRRLAA